MPRALFEGAFDEPQLSSFPPEKHLRHDPPESKRKRAYLSTIRHESKAAIVSAGFCGRAVYHTCLRAATASRFRAKLPDFPVFPFSRRKRGNLIGVMATM